jgi:hypothetical protein
MPRSKKALKTRLVAKTMLDVLIATGRINMKKVRAQLYPDAADSTNDAHGWKLLTPEVREEFLRVMQADEGAVAKLDRDGVIKGILDDLQVCDRIIQTPDVDIETVIRTMNTKSVKQKLQCQILGILGADREQEKEETDPDAIFQRNRRLLSGLPPTS